MENADSGVKRPRMDSSSPMNPNTNVRIKQEAAEETVAGGEAATPTAAAAETAAAAAAARDEVAVRIDAAVLHCPLCLLPLKPPIFQCGAGHMACGECHGKLADAQCLACGGGAAAYAHNPALDAFARSAKIRCPNHKYGCDSYVTYYDVADHQRACRHAPCYCPEPGCGGFLASPPALVEHLTGDHSWPAMDITYRNVHLLRMPASERRCLLVVRGDDGGESRVFLLAVARHGAATAVSVSCVRAAAGPQFTCKVWTQAPADAETGFEDTIMMEANVRSFAVPGEVAMEEGTVLSVPPWMLHGESMEMLLRVRIDKLRPKN